MRHLFTIERLFIILLDERFDSHGGRKPEYGKIESVGQFFLFLGSKLKMNVLLILSYLSKPFQKTTSPPNISLSVQM